MIGLKKLITMSNSDIIKLKIGLKAENLVWLAKNNYFDQIPPFFVLPSEECEQIIENKTNISEMIRNIKEISSELNSEYFFIRSSTQVEDKVGIPTAGLFLSLGKISLNELNDAIIKCIMSTRKEKIREILGFFPLTAVIIQKMVFSFSSGVLFTKNPVSNDKSRILIEAGYGLGKTVVSGSFNIDHYEIDKSNLNTILKYEIVEKFRYISPHSNSIETIPNKLRKKPVLSNDQLISLSKQALILENIYEKPIDLEWAIDFNNKIWFLQVRDAQ